MPVAPEHAVPAVEMVAGSLRLDWQIDDDVHGATSVAHLAPGTRRHRRRGGALPPRPSRRIRRPRSCDLPPERRPSSMMSLAHRRPMSCQPARRAVCAMCKTESINASRREKKMPGREKCMSPGHENGRGRGRGRHLRRWAQHRGSRRVSIRAAPGHGAGPLAGGSRRPRQPLTTGTSPNSRAHRAGSHPSRRWRAPTPPTTAVSPQYRSQTGC